MAFIYRITNLVNGKKYIGQTTFKDPNQRWKGHLKAINQGRGCPFLRKAVLKHGVENFKFEVILECTNEEKDQKEREYIASENSLIPNGYNMAKGGAGGGFLGKTHSDESRAKISAATKHMLETMDPERWMEITKKISESNKKAKAFVSAETRAKISKRKKECLEKNPMSESTKKKISQGLHKYHTSIESGVKSVSDETRRKISEAAKKRKEKGTTAKFTEEMKKKQSDIMTVVRGVKVDQYTLDGIFVKTFLSKTLAAKEIGITYSSIHNVVIGKKKTAGGFLWKLHTPTDTEESDSPEETTS